MSTASRRSSRRSTVVSTLSSTSPVAAPAPKTSPTVAQPTTPTKQASTEIVKEATLANCPLYLECEDDALSVAQKVFHTKRIKEFQVNFYKLNQNQNREIRITSETALGDQAGMINCNFNSKQLVFSKIYIRCSTQGYAPFLFYSSGALAFLWINRILHIRQPQIGNAINGGYNSQSSSL